MKKKTFFITGLSLSFIIITLYIVIISYCTPYYENDLEPILLTSGYLIPARLIDDQQDKKKTGDIVIIQFDDIKTFNSGRGTADIYLVWNKQNSLFRSMNKKISSSKCIPLFPKEIRELFGDKGYIERSGILNLRDKPVIHDDLNNGFKLQSQDYDGREPLLGGPGEANLSHPTLFYGDESIKIVAYDYGSHGGADNELIYEVKQKSRPQIIIHEFVMRGVKFPCD